ncbi:TetR/AcrR family transcriptional regulator, partial [Achromobacter xylosoxidans]
MGWRGHVLIAATAGISKPMLYVHFGDKEALFDAVLSRE